MIFRQHQQVKDGTKTQTRRVKKEGEELIDDVGIVKNGRMHHRIITRLYPIIPKRGLKNVGHFQIVYIHEERLQEISEAEAHAEGVASVAEYEQLWRSINTRKGTRWEDNPVVFVYSIRGVS